MRTQIKIYDTLLENAKDTVTAEINPPAPLRVVFAYGGAMSAEHMDYEAGLLKLMESICKKPEMVRKLKIEVELENEGDK